VIKTCKWMIPRIASSILILLMYVSLVHAATSQVEAGEKILEYKGAEMKDYGKEINADPLQLRRLFGLSRELDTAPAAREKKNGWLGIAMKQADQSLQETATKQIFPAIEVTHVLPDSPAKEAGLRKGDLIVDINDKSIEKDNAMMTFGQAIRNMQPDDEMQLKVMREGKLIELDVSIKSYPVVKPVLKKHPDLETYTQSVEQSLLESALYRGDLADKFSRLLEIIQDETEKVESMAVKKDRYNPFRLQEVNYVMHRPLDLPVVARKHITNPLHEAFDKTQHDISGLLNSALVELDMESSTTQIEAMKQPADFMQYIERLLKAVHHANTERDVVLSALDEGELDFLYEAATDLLKEESGAIKVELTEKEKQEEEVYWLRFLDVVLKLDMARLMKATAKIVRALDIDTLAVLDRNLNKLGHFPADWEVKEEKNLTVVDTPEGRVLIGGVGDNTYTEDAMLILDFGGNDKYLNQVGGGTRSNPFSIGIDLSGDDIYIATNDFAQGGALLGGGFLIDLDGNDQYMARNHSQGTGILGIGVLADLAGRDRYQAVAAAQGAGGFGVGLLAEGGGDDTYYGNRFVQGFGYVKGYGAIIEAGGNDNYFSGAMYEDNRAPGKSYQSMSQGFGYGMRPWETLAGASGGIGVIAEAEGNDTYVADYFAQGSSYWFALGVLDDRQGNDRYISGRYSQGAGIHFSAGVLIDSGGDDNYFADYGVAQGCGHDYGIGFLLDNGGSDRYIAGILAQGAGNDDGLGILSDNGGDDEYSLKSLGQGRGNIRASAGSGGFGLLFDTGGGRDIYSQGGKNSSLIYRSQWGISADID